MHSKTPSGVNLVERAYKAANEAHGGQKRFSGEPYFNHVYATAKVLAELRMCPESITAGLLHDTVEDGLLSEDEILKQFGEEVLFLIKGVTKLGKLQYQGMERHTESLRKLFIATAQDIRVLIIRLADRLHNAQTLGGHPSSEKRKRIAVETLEIFVPIANRLGIGQLRGELEDAAFPFAYPKEYEKTKELLRQRKGLNEKYLEKVHRALQKELGLQHIHVKKIDYRFKRIYSLYRKLLRNDWDIDKIHDVVALRVVVPTVEDCYRVLGIVHSMWKPLPGRIKDYIAVPKANGYQSIHTTIFTGDGGITEIQIRTQEMHDASEYGVTSNLAYKETGKGAPRGAEQKFKKELHWVGQLLEWQKSVSESGEFLNTLKMDFFKDRVFVFTPHGDVIDLPEESSMVDFAYAIHTDIGNRMSGAKVNGKFVALDTKLKNGDIVEIATRKDAHPSPKWLKYSKTSLAQRHIRAATEKQSISLKSFFGKK